MIVLSTIEYNEIVKCVRNYEGIPFDIDSQIVFKFKNIPEETICSIISKEWQNIIKNTHHRILANAKKLLIEVETAFKTTGSHDVILNLAINLRFSPVGLCRILLAEKYNAFYKKSDLAEMLKNTSYIDDTLFSLNVNKCIFNDKFDGPLVDICRRCIGEEFEVKLKEMATNAGMVFYDENYLRRIGYDKTPDLKLAIPFMYQNKVIHWIESKALFGDYESHQKYIKSQLSSYTNR